MLGNKFSLSKLKKIEIMSNIFSNHKAMRLEISHKKKSCKKHTNIWKLNNMLLNNHGLTEDMKEEIKNYLATNENGLSSDF